MVGKVLQNFDLTRDSDDSDVELFRSSERLTKSPSLNIINAVLDKLHPPVAQINPWEDLSPASPPPYERPRLASPTPSPNRRLRLQQQQIKHDHDCKFPRFRIDFPDFDHNNLYTNRSSASSAPAVTAASPIAQNSVQNWSTANLTDFLIVADGTDFKVHKKVISLECRVIAEALEDDEEENEMKIPDVSAESVKDFLNLIYTGRIAETANAIDLYSLADKYNAPNLKTQIVEEMSKKLTTINAMKTFEFAHNANLQDLKTKAFNELKKLFPTQDLPESFINDVQGLKELAKAARSCKRKIAKAEKEFATIIKKKLKK